MDFDNGQINITRSVVYRVISRCKTESSSKPVPMCLQLSEMLKKRRRKPSSLPLMIGCLPVHERVGNGLSGVTL